MTNALTSSSLAPLSEILRSSLPDGEMTRLVQTSIYLFPESKVFCFKSLVEQRNHNFFSAARFGRGSLRAEAEISAEDTSFLPYQNSL